MTIKPFIVQTANRVECAAALTYLEAVGYGRNVGGFTGWANEYPTYLAIYVSGGGNHINTRTDRAHVVREFANAKTVLFFPTFRAFLTSNRNVKIDGTPMAARFSGR